MKVKELKAYLAGFKDDAEVGIFEGYLELYKVNPPERKKTYIIREIESVMQHEDAANDQCIIMTKI